MKKKTFIILYPFKFRSFDEKRFELDLLKKKNLVIILEFINLLFPHFVKAYKTEKKIKNLIKLKSIVHFLQVIKNIKSKNENIIVLNFLKNDSFKALLIQFILHYFFPKKISFLNPGISTFDKGIINSNFCFYKKILLLFRRPNETLNKVKGKFLFLFIKLFNFFIQDYIFVAGKKCLEKLNVSNSKIIKGNSWDISNIFSRKKKKFFKKKYAVYLDAPGPKYLSDSFLFKEKPYETVFHTYPLLKKTFNNLEKKMKLNIIIAPHPKTKIKDRSDLFGGRRVISKKTIDLIRYSSMIITRNSTAVSIACYYSKPIILFYTNETIGTEAQYSTLLLSRSLGLKAVNLDKFHKYNLKELLKFKKINYKKYLHNYCTFERLKTPNYKIWEKLKNEKN